MVSQDGPNTAKHIISLFFQPMFSVQEVAEHFSLGKTKSRYTMLDGIVPELKKILLYDVNQSPFLAISYD